MSADINNIDTRLIIISLRELKNWKPSDLAKRANVSAAAISDIESGKKTASFQTLQKIANAFDMDLIDLLSYDPKKLGNENVYRDIEINLKNISKEDVDLIKWANNRENLPYIKFAFKLSKIVSPEMVERIKPVIDITED